MAKRKKTRLTPKGAAKISAIAKKRWARYRRGVAKANWGGWKK